MDKKEKKIDIFIKGDVFVVEVVLDRGIVIIALDKEKLIFWMPRHCCKNNICGRETAVVIILDIDVPHLYMMYLL